MQGCRPSTQGLGALTEGRGARRGGGGGSMKKINPSDSLLKRGGGFGGMKNRTPTRSHLRRGWGLGHESPLSRAWSGMGARMPAVNKQSM